MRTLLAAALMTLALEASAAPKPSPHCSQFPAKDHAACAVSHTYYFKVLEAKALELIPDEPAGFRADLLNQAERDKIDSWTQKLLVDFGVGVVSSKKA